MSNLEKKSLVMSNFLPLKCVLVCYYALAAITARRNVIGKSLGNMQLGKHLEKVL